MRTLTHQEHRAVLRDCGFPVTTTHDLRGQRATPEQIKSTVATLLQEPSARAVEGVSAALLRLAQYDADPAVASLSDHACRRLGFISEEMAGWDRLPQPIRAKLRGWARNAEHCTANSTREPIGLYAPMSARSLASLQRWRDTPRQSKWGVYGSVDLREGVLKAFCAP